MDFKQRLSDLLVQNNHSQAELARFVGVKNNTVNDWINKGTSPKIDNIYRIAEFFGISFDNLFTSNEASYCDLSEDEVELLKYYNQLPEKEQVKLVARAETLAEYYQEQYNDIQIPTISVHCSENRVSAGLGEDLNEYEQWDTVNVVDTKESRKADFMLIVDGDSMEPRFHDGDYVLVRQQPAVNIGEIGIFDVNGKGYIKKYNGNTLVSLNPAYDDIKLCDDNCRCFGLVLGVAELV